MWGKGAAKFFLSLSFYPKNVEIHWVKICLVSHSFHGFKLNSIQIIFFKCHTCIQNDALSSFKTLKNVIAVQFEFGGTAIDAKTYFKDYWNFFQELNFSIYRYTPLGLLKINEYSEREELYEYMNYIAVPFESNKKINLETLL